MALPLVLGCAGENEAMRKDVADLRSELVKLRADQAALSNRLGALEVAKSRVDESKSGSRAQGDRPELSVVKLEPGADGASPTAPTPEAGEDVLAEAEKAVSAGKCEGETEKLRRYIKADTDGPSVDVAMFLLGQCLYLAGDFKGAVEQWEAVASGFAYGTRTPDALSRLIEVQQKLGDKSRSDRAKETLLATYPSSEAAKRWKKK